MSMQKYRRTKEEVSILYIQKKMGGGDFLFGF